MVRERTPSGMKETYSSQTSHRCIRMFETGFERT